MMKLVSVNAGLPRRITWEGREITTGIFKEPIHGKVMLRTLNLEGDRQADLSVHGGASKAVYAYPSEHYAYWRGELPDTALPWGMFGENFTTEGMIEEAVHVGDRFQIGEAEVTVTEPRLPCYKLGAKFSRTDMVKRFLASRRTGFYLSVVQEGAVQAGDTIEPLARDPVGISIADITRLYAFDKDDLTTMRRVVQIEALSEGWRRYFLAEIDKLTR